MIEPSRSSLRPGIRIFLLCALLLAAACSAIVWLVQRRAQDDAQQSATLALEKSADAVTSQTQQRLRLLERSALLLGRDDALLSQTAALVVPPQSDESGATRESMLATLRQSIDTRVAARREELGFDLVMVLDPAGVVLVRSDRVDLLGDAPLSDPLILAARDKRAAQSGFWREGDSLLQAAVLPLTRDGAVAGFLLLAQRVDTTLAADIARASDAQLAFWLPGADGLVLAASSWPDGQSAALQQAFAARPDVVDAVRSGQPIDQLPLDIAGTPWLLRMRPTAIEADPTLGAVSALASPGAATGAASALRDMVFMAGLALLLLALPLSFWVARRVLQPARLLADAAERAAMGDDTGPVAVPGDDALSRLSRAVDSLLAEQREMRAVAQYLDSVSRFLPEAEPAILAAEAPSLAPTPQHITGLWLGAEFAPAPDVADAATRQQQTIQLTDTLQSVAERTHGRLLRGDGQRWVFCFEGEAALEHALHAAGALLDGIPRDGFRTPALGLIEGAADAGGVPLADGASATLSGIPIYQLERLLCESGAGRALLTRDVGERLQSLRGTGWLNVAHGALSNKRFFALNPETVKTLAPLVHVPSPSSSPSPPLAIEAHGLRPGQRIDGRYEVLSQLGEDATGIVYKALDRSVPDVIALRMLHPRHVSDPLARARLHEAIAQARQIQHPNVLRPLDAGDVDGRMYVSMEFTRGASVRALLGESGVLPYAVGLRIARQVCAGLAAAHELGVIHGDIRCEHVIVEPSGNARLTGFGMALSRARLGQASVAGAAPVRGLAPPPAAGDVADDRADTFATGVLLSELFCGELSLPDLLSALQVHDGVAQDDVDDAVAEHARAYHDNVDPTPQPCANLPPALRRILLRCVARDVAQRYQTVAELGADLSQLRA